MNLSVSVDGYNLPMRIDNNKECGVADCPVDLGPSCGFTIHTVFARSVYYRLLRSFPTRWALQCYGVPCGMQECL